MDYLLNLLQEDLLLIERYLPYVAASLKPSLIDTVLFTNREELQNLQKALSEVLMIYGFDENYDANAVGRQIENLMDSIQRALKS